MHTLPLATTLTVGRNLPDALEASVGFGKRLGGDVVDGLAGAADGLMDTIDDAGGALASSGKSAWNAVTSIF